MQNMLNRFIAEKISIDAVARINVVALYANAEAGKRTIQAYDRLVQRFGKQADFNCDFWTFNALHHRTIQAQAGRELANAHLVLVAPDGSNQVPDQVESWLQLCTVRSTRSRQPLVSTLKAPPATRKVPQPAIYRAARPCSIIDMFLEPPVGHALAMAS